MRTLILTVLTVSTLVLPLRAAERKARTEKELGFTGLLPMNTADLPDRCPADGLYLDLKAPEWNAKPKSAYAMSGSAVNPARAFLAGHDPIEAILDNGNPDSPALAIYVAKKTDYYNRRKAVADAVEARLAGLSTDAKKGPLRSWAYLLLYLGDFTKLMERFAPGQKDWDLVKDDGIVTFARAQAEWHLGHYKDSIELSKKAYKLLPDAIMDTRWQLMMAELAEYKDDIFRKHSTDYYTLDHVKELFPNPSPEELPFEDVTDKFKIPRWGGTGSASFADLDKDGWDDLVFSRKFFTFKQYRNLAGKGFEPLPADAVESDNCTALVEEVVDFDNDGNLDLQRGCCNYNGPGPTLYLKNVGGLKFKDVTKKAGMDYRTSAMWPSWGDYDLDGYLDVAVTDLWGPTRLFHNKGDGTFEEVTAKAGVITPGGRDADDYGALGAAFGDYDGDRLPDLFAQGWGWAMLFHNNGDGTFTDVTVKAGVDLGKSVRGYNSLFFDYNNDGKLDIFAGRYVINSSDRWGYGPRCTCSNLLAKEGFPKREWLGAGTIYRNNGDGTFTNMAETTRFMPLGVMGVNTADWNNDGYQDIVMGAGGPFMQQAEPFFFYQNNGGDGTFKNITPFTMTSLWGKGHGAAFGDYDHDGNLDLYLNNGGTFPGDIWPSLLLHNRGNENHFIEITFKSAAGTNSYAVGVQVDVTAGKLKQTQELAVGGRFAASNTFNLHFGLAGHSRVDRVEVRWPNAKKDVTVIEGVDADQTIEVSEADGSWKTLWTSPRGKL